MRRSAIVALSFGLASVACAGGSVEPAGAPPSLVAVELPGMTMTEATIDAERASADAVDTAAVRDALQDAGFRSGVEHTYTGGAGAFTRIVVRALAFESAEAAGGFIGWLGADGAATLLTATQRALDVPTDVLVLSHEPDACCPRDTPIYLAAWQRGADVILLRAGGRTATDRAMERLVRRLEEAI